MSERSVKAITYQGDIKADKIKEYSDRARKNIEDGFHACLDVLRKKKKKSPIDDDFAVKQDNA